MLKNYRNKKINTKMKTRAFSSQLGFSTIFSKSILGFQFWTFIFVHFSKPNSLFGFFIQEYKIYIL